MLHRRAALIVTAALLFAGSALLHPSKRPPLRPRGRRGGAALLFAGAPVAPQTKQPPPPPGVDGTLGRHAMPKLGGGTEGFQIDLFTEVAKRMGREITFDSVSFSTLIPVASRGRYDFIAAPTTVTKERAEQMLFTAGYLWTAYQFGIRKGSAPIKDWSDLKGKVGVGQQGHALRDALEKDGRAARLHGAGLRHAARRDPGGAFRPRLRHARRQHHNCLRGEQEPELHRRPRAERHARALGGAVPQGQRGAEEPDAGRDQLHEEGRHDRQALGALVRQTAAARRPRARDHARLRRTRHARLRSDSAQPEVH